ncbi:LytTR family DNA-binding domain-containing protein [Tabrizicola sp. TH137]|uniref:LytTR family DNA-binding domain-containing protein n=1 Tax=Tabrizicola sp. TH137 TaxID=2067452 RepID=UPI001181384D|nr:LytTR family DNA-binding domain-containing protein [Tabrizicola sp. TH137]
MAQDDGAVVLRLMTCRVSFAAGDDLGRVFRHRYVLLQYLVLSLPILVTFLMFNPTAALYAPHLPPVVVGLVAMMWFLAGYVALLRLVLTRLGGGRVVPLTPGLVLGAPILLLTAKYAGNLIGMEAQWSPLRLQLLTIVLTFYLELAATLVLRGAVPRALAQLRAEQRVAQSPAVPPVMRAAEARAAEAPAREADLPDAPEALRDLLRLEAQGNYVLVVTAGGRHLLPGPLSAMVARLPESQGRRVHRSHWVAARAVVGMRRSARSLVIDTQDGAKVPVAIGQVAQVQAWAEPLVTEGGAGRQEAGPEGERGAARTGRPAREAAGRSRGAATRTKP